MADMSRRYRTAGLLAGCALIFLGCTCDGGTTKTGPAVQKDVDPPAELGFDENDAGRSFRWWAEARDKAPYPLAEDTGNRVRDKSMDDWHREWD
jgi:hypothetical protein